MTKFCEASWHYDAIEWFILSNPNPNKYLNIHTRGTKQHKGRRVLAHLNAMCLEHLFIDCFVCGPGVEIRYRILRSCEFEVINCNILSRKELHNYILKLKKEIAQKVAAGHIQSPHTKTSSGQFYLRRDVAGRMTPAASMAISQGLLTEDFVEWVTKRRFIIIEGR